MVRGNGKAGKAVGYGAAKYTQQEYNTRHGAAMGSAGKVHEPMAGMVYGTGKVWWQQWGNAQGQKGVTKAGNRS